MLTEASYADVLNLAVGALLLAAVLVVWRRTLSALVRLLAWQGLALAAIPIATGLYTSDARLIVVGAIVGLLRAIAIPRLIARLLPGDDAPRETAPLLNTAASLLAAAAVTVMAYAVTRPLVALDPSLTTKAAPAALAVVFVGIFTVVTRRRALSQVVGFVLMDNGIAALAFLIAPGVPLIVEMGASLDVLLAVLVLQVLGNRMRVKFGGTDLAEMRELHD